MNVSSTSVWDLELSVSVSDLPSLSLTSYLDSREQELLCWDLLLRIFCGRNDVLSIHGSDLCCTYLISNFRILQRWLRTHSKLVPAQIQIKSNLLFEDIPNQVEMHSAINYSLIGSDQIQYLCVQIPQTCIFLQWGLLLNFYWPANLF